MLYTLPESAYDKVRKMFNDKKFNIRVMSVIERNTKGRIWVDNIKNPSSALVWSYFDIFSLGGNEKNEQFNYALEQFILENIVPEAQSIGLHYFAVQLHPVDTWEKIIREIFARPLEINYEYCFAFNYGLYQKFSRVNTPSHGVLVQVDADFLEKGVTNPLRTEITETWDSLDAFMQKGVGVCLVLHDEIVCRCISRHVAGNHHNMSIFTAKEHRKRGFATLTAQTFIDICLSRGLIPVWMADEDNTASIRIAEKLGFEKTGKYPDYYFIF
ncbi:MAG: GNAT family N-acetyltransferase [Candidatus Methanofastidiosia archaeon]|jgi:L-amino acid N-acyltransferase YncA